jgi:hypothetical protein
LSSQLSDLESDALTVSTRMPTPHNPAQPRIYVNIDVSPHENVHTAPPRIYANRSVSPHENTNTAPTLHFPPHHCTIISIPQHAYICKMHFPQHEDANHTELRTWVNTHSPPHNMRSFFPRPSSPTQRFHYKQTGVGGTRSVSWPPLEH